MKKLSEVAMHLEVEIVGIEPSEYSNFLIEMGCTVGQNITPLYKAPLGDPIAYSVSGYTLALRKKEAETIIVK